MSAVGTTRATPAAAGFSRGTQWWTLFVFTCGGGVVLIEPSPYEFAFFLALFVFMVSGLRLGAGGLVMIVLLMLYNIGGLFSLIPFLDDGDAVRFIGVSFYLAVTAAFFAALVQEDAQWRMHALTWGLVSGATIASIAGILGYFDIAGLGAIFTLHDRASGTFKDPNVLGTFVILPLVLLAQAVLLSGRLRLRYLVPMAIIVFGGVFLSFSRGAWGHMILSMALMTLLTFMFVAGPQQRLRITVLAITGIIGALVALAVALSIEELRSMFELRAAVVQHYDVGATGRFGRIGRAIPELLDRPNGYGPMQFRRDWFEDPHNVYLNAFAAYGWLGGLSYLLLIGATIFVGWRLIATPSDMQAFAIAVWSVLFVQILQGMTIDTDHWRHFYLLLGLTWGLFDRCARRPHHRRSPASQPASTA
ncbi:MAG: O-antigen ligase family protein [Salinarimonas sp.]|nr:O-antigen ligase family protein [Salinarimonas sp.]